MALRALELFAGIGGFSVASHGWQVVAAVDISRDASQVFQANFATTYWIRELESIPFDWLHQQAADLWWMSPPCSPFTSKGNRRDLTDPRCKALLHMIEAVVEVRPASIILENVEGFESSKASQHLQHRWSANGYQLEWIKRCPSQLGWPNRRPRVYCLASLGRRRPFPEPSYQPRPLRDFIDPSVHRDREPQWWLDVETYNRYERAVHRVEAGDDLATSACFASAYGRSITRSGSYLVTEQGCRRFTPREVANLLGFPESFRFPSEMPYQKLWHHLGNSLSIPVVEHLLQAIP